ncbi:MAG: hypothetical protein PWQ35_523 [Patescibacteria group bacterium]|nr:hypothetical protein [Patescibacteria group bacterium]
MIKKITHYLNKRYNRFYRRSRLYIIIDITLIAIVIILAALLLRLYAFQPEISLTPWTKPAPREEINLNNPPLDLNYEVNTTNIYWQEGVVLTLRLKNNSSQLLSDIKLSLISRSDSFSLSRLEFSTEQKTSLSGMEIKGFDLFLNELAPGTDREVNLLVKFKKENNNSRIITGRIDSEYKVLKQTIKESLDLTELRVASEISVNADAYYTSPQGDQLGTGPFPPIVSLPTSFWIFFQADTVADFNNFVMSGRLPNNVEYTGNQSLLAGKLNYNADARQIIWQVEKVSPDSGSYRAGFEVTLTPTEADINSYATLMTSIRFQSQDIFTGLTVSGNLPAIDTSLKKDVINSGDGLIQDLNSL